MDDLPASVAAQLQHQIFSASALAWLNIDASLTLIGAGGDLRNHGLVSLRVGQPVVEQVYFLQGLLPLTEAHDFVPAIELTSARAADLHFYRDNGTTWVILLDVTAERDAARRMQQKAYDMTLLQEREAQLNRRLEAANSALVIAHRQLEQSREAVREELRRKQQELDEARTLQLSLVPPPFHGIVAGCPLMIDVILEPAKEVGGDLVDHFFIEDDLLVLLLGDVSGKGAGAALFMARTHASFRSIAARPDASVLFRAPERAARLVNEALAAGNSDCTFVTMLLAAFDLRTKRLTYVRAGHVAPFLRRANGTVERLSATGGLPLGIMEDAVHKPAAVTLCPGDELLIVTDGVTEAMDAVHGMFGEKRVTELVGGPDSEGGINLHHLLEQIRSFEAGNAQSDDIAAISLRLGGDTS